MGRTVDDVALLLGVLGAPDDRDPMQRPLDPRPSARRRTGRCASPGRPTSACPSSPSSSPCSPAPATRWRTSGGTSSTPRPSSHSPATASACCGRGTSPTAPTAASTTACDEIKATIQDEIRRGEAYSQPDVATRTPATRRWVRTAAFFDEGYDLLACPVTQVAPFPTEWEYPTEVDGIAMANYIDWMEACWLITTTGCPALSLPAGFDAAGLPVGVQLVARQGARRRPAARRQGAGGGHRLAARQPPVVGGRVAIVTAPIQDRVAGHGDAVAIVDPAGDWTFTEIDDDAVRLAGALPVAHGDRVGDPRHGRPRPRRRRPRLLARRRHRRPPAPAEPRPRARLRPRRQRRRRSSSPRLPTGRPPTASPRRRHRRRRRRRPWPRAPLLAGPRPPGADDLHERDDRPAEGRRAHPRRWRRWSTG